jgi:hypothetical protein
MKNLTPHKTVLSWDMSVMFLSLIKNLKDEETTWFEIALT